MPSINGWDAQEQCNKFREARRVRLACTALARVMGRGGTVHVADLPKADLVNLLGELWLLYGHRERRKITRARDVDVAILKVLLDGAHTEYTEADGVLTVVKNKEALAMLAEHHKRRESTQASLVQSGRELRSRRAPPPPTAGTNGAERGAMQPAAVPRAPRGAAMVAEGQPSTKASATTDVQPPTKASATTAGQPPAKASATTAGQPSAAKAPGRAATTSGQPPAKASATTVGQPPSATKAPVGQLLSGAKASAAVKGQPSGAKASAAVKGQPLSGAKAPVITEGRVLSAVTRTKRHPLPATGRAAQSASLLPPRSAASLLPPRRRSCRPVPYH